jgi:hypothetical protein
MISHNADAVYCMSRKQSALFNRTVFFEPLTARAVGDFIAILNNEQGSRILVILTTGFITVYLLFHIKD